MVNWRNHFTENSAWYEKVPHDILENSEFHEELGKKIDEIIAKTLKEEPTKKQIDSIEKLQGKLGTNYTYGCKAEANYVERILKQKI